MVAIDSCLSTIPICSHILEEEGVDLVYFILSEFWEVDSTEGPGFYITDGEVVRVERDECSMGKVLGDDRDTLGVFGPVAPAQRSVGILVLVGVCVGFIAPCERPMWVGRGTRQVEGRDSVFIDAPSQD